MAHYEITLIVFGLLLLSLGGGLWIMASLLLVGLASQVIRMARDTKSASSSTCRVTKLLKVIFQGLPA